MAKYKTSNNFIESIDNVKLSIEQEINNIHAYYSDNINNILKKISINHKIPLKTLNSYLNNSQSLIDIEDNDVEQNKSFQNSSQKNSDENEILVKIKIKNKEYFVDQNKKIIYKILKNSKAKKVGKVNLKGEYILNKN